MFLAIKDDAASLTAEQVKEMLSPVLDFKAMRLPRPMRRAFHRCWPRR